MCLLYFLSLAGECVFEVTDPVSNVEYTTDEAGNRCVKIVCEGKDGISLVFHCLSSEKKSKSSKVFLSFLSG